MQHYYFKNENNSETNAKKELDERIDDFLCFSNCFELKVKDSIVKGLYDFASSYECSCGKKSVYEYFKN